MLTFLLSYIKTPSTKLTQPLGDFEWPRGFQVKCGSFQVKRAISVYSLLCLSLGMSPWVENVIAQTHAPRDRAQPAQPDKKEKSPEESREGENACVQFMKESKGKGKPEVCSLSELSRFFASARPQQLRDYERCLVELDPPDRKSDNPWVVCARPEFQSHVLSEDFKLCKNLLPKADPCISRKATQRILRANCEKEISKQLRDRSLSEELCEFSDAQRIVLKETGGECLAGLASKSMLLPKVIAGSCIDALARSEFRKKIFDHCASELNRLGLFAESIVHCAHDPSKISTLVADKKYSSCVERGVRSSYDLSLILGGADFSSGRIQGPPFGHETDILRDCQSDTRFSPGSGNAPGQVRVWADLHVHSEAPWKLPGASHGIVLGGFSGIQYDATSDSFLLITDSKDYSEIYRIRLALPEVRGGQLSLVLLDLIPLKQPGSRRKHDEQDTGIPYQRAPLDREDLAVLRNGDFIISSELSAGQERYFEQQLTYFQKGGKIKAHLKLTDSFLPQFETLPPPPENPGQEPPTWPAVAAPRKNTKQVWKQTSGIQWH